MIYFFCTERFFLRPKFVPNKRVGVHFAVAVRDRREWVVEVIALEPSDSKEEEKKTQKKRRKKKKKKKRRRKKVRCRDEHRQRR